MNYFLYLTAEEAKILKKLVTEADNIEASVCIQLLEKMTKFPDIEAEIDE